ncbi:MAG: hypothetical protein QF733_03820 [Phycisphaerales bacterium]|jgi:hypothetical protein|nr:hypothetical protein [Phycisphaerales bacterium]
MTSETTPLTSNELAELAILDTYGLLHDAELLRFEQAFMGSPPDVQAEIRRIQAEIATDERLLPTCEPPAELKAKVLDRIRSAMALSTAGMLVSEPDAFPHPTMHRDSERGTFLGSVWTWRMAALLLLGVTITLVATNTSSQRHVDQLNLEAMRLITGHEVEVALADQYRPFMELMRTPEARHAYLAAAGGEGLVRVSIDESTGRAFVLAMDLVGHDGPCRLEITAADGTPLASAELRTDRYLDATTMDLDAALIAGATLHLTDGLGRTIATTRLA